MKIEFETDNQAFEEDVKTLEIARILNRVRDRVERGEESGLIKDINGNTIGTWAI